MVVSERERERANGKGKGCEAIKEFKRRGGQDAEPYLDVDHNERRWDQGVVRPLFMGCELRGFGRGLTQ